MMRIVINQNDITHFSINRQRSIKSDFETSPNPAKVFQCTDNETVLYAHTPGGSQGCQSILHVVYSRQPQMDDPIRRKGIAFICTRSHAETRCSCYLHIEGGIIGLSISATYCLSLMRKPFNRICQNAARPVA